MPAASERSCLCLFGGVLFPVVHLLLELLRLLFVNEAEPGEAFLHFEGMEKGAVMVVTPRIKDLLIPNNSSRSRGYVHHLQPVRMADQIVGEDNCALYTGVGPFLPARVGDVELSNSDGMDFVGLLRHESLDGIFVVIAQN